MSGQKWKNNLLSKDLQRFGLGRAGHFNNPLVG
jgi:hypothetical protein